MEPKSPSKLKLSVAGVSQCKRILRICGLSGLALVIVLSITGACFVFYHGKTRKAFESSYYTVVVDGGSTGTRVNVYEWKTRGIDSHEMPILGNSYSDDSAKILSTKKSCRYHCMQTEPGLDKFVGNSSGLRASLEPLIHLAEEWVPLERRTHTPIFVLATAGLRKLAIEDTEWILSEVESIVSEHAFRYSRKGIRVLSGKEEAYYGWLALNNKIGRLGNFTNAPTLGLLDLGGSSLQVVVEVDEVKADRHFMLSNVGSIEHKLLSYSLPELGLNEAFDRSVATLIQMEPVNGSTGDIIKISHPCLGYDFSQNYTCYDCVNRSRQIRKTEFSHVYLVGDPNWKRCKMLAKFAATNFVASDWPHATDGTNGKANLFSFGGSSILNLTAIAHPEEHFHALSGFFAVSNALNLSSRANLTEIWEKSQDICSKSWDRSGHVLENHNYAAQYCFRLPYIASLFEDTLVLGDKDIMFGPSDISWTLGAALVEGQYLWHNKTESHTRILVLTNMEFFYSPVIVFVLLMCFLFIFYRCQVRLPMPGKKVSALGASLPSFVTPKRRPNW